MSGTLAYAPPEMHRAGNVLTPAFDVWSFGVTLHTLLTKTVAPWPERYMRDHKSLVYYLTELYDDQPPAFDHPNLDELSRDLIASILRSNPDDRPTIQDLTEHPFFHEEYPEPKAKRNHADVLDTLIRVPDEGFKLPLTSDVAAIPARLAYDVPETISEPHMHQWSQCTWQSVEV